jgi:hypothetical protein
MFKVVCRLHPLCQLFYPDVCCSHCIAEACLAQGLREMAFASASSLFCISKTESLQIISLLF